MEQTELRNLIGMLTSDDEQTAILALGIYVENKHLKENIIYKLNKNWFRTYGPTNYTPCFFRSFRNIPKEFVEKYSIKVNHLDTPHDRFFYI